MSNLYRKSISPLSIREVFSALCTADPRIQQFRFGDFAKDEQFAGNEFPLVMIDPTETVLSNPGTLNRTEWTVSVACFSMRRKGWEGLAETQSDLYNILLDLVLRMRSDAQLRAWGWSFAKEEKIPFTIYDKTNRAELTAVMVDITFSCPVTLTPCDLLNNASLPDAGLAYSGTGVAPSQFLTCTTLRDCPVIGSILIDIAAISGSTGSSTFIQNGSNTYTGGTATRPSVNVVTDPFFGDVTANNLTAATLISSPQVSADLGIFSDLEIQAFTVNDLTVTKHLYVGQLAEEIFGPTYVQNGTNTTTGGTEMRPTVDVVADPTFNSLNVGTINAATLGSGTINGGLLLSGGTDLSTIIQRSRTRIIPGSNLVTGGTLGAQTVDVVSSPSFVSISASTIFSGGVDLSRYLTGATQVRIQEGTNITTGGTAFAPTINVVASPSFTSVATGSIDVGGTANIGTINAGAIDASFIFSAGTNLSLLLTGSSRNLSVRTSTATSITPGLGDAHGLITASAATPITFVIPSNGSTAFPIGTQLMIEQGSNGQVRFSAATSVTLNSYGSAFNLVGQYATAFVTKTDLNRWVIDGNLTTLNL